MDKTQEIFNKNNKPLLAIYHLSKSCFRFAPFDCILILIFALLRSVTSGIGLLLIIPLLHVVGIPILGHSNSVLAQKVQAALLVLHIPLHLISILLFFIFVITLVATIHLFEALIRSKWGERYQLYLRETIYKLLLNTKYTFFIKNNNSNLLDSLTSQLQASWQCNHLLLQLMNQLILVLVYFILSSFISWKITMIASVIALGLLALMRPLHKLTVQAGHYYFQRNQMLFQSFYEQLCGGLKMIKSSHSETLFIAKTLEHSKSEKNIIHQLAKVNALSKWLYSVGGVIAFSLLLYLSIATLKLPLDVLVLQLLVFSRIMPLMSALQQHYQQLQRFLPSYYNLEQIRSDCLLHQENREARHVVSVVFQREIRFDQVGFSYNPEILPKVIQQFSMQLKKNTTTAIIGPSGIGKTTIADLILGLLEPTQGAIYIDDHILDHKTLGSWRRSVAYVPQNSFLFNLSVRENLELFGGPQDEKSIWGVLKQVSAHVFVANLEQGLDTVIGERGIRLSGGECQRLAIARALLMRPQLLVLDESTNSLDSQSIQMIQETLLDLRGTMTIIIISHQAEMSALVDQIIDLKHLQSLPQTKDIEFSFP